jgi:hypothetical protein
MKGLPRRSNDTWFKSFNGGAGPAPYAVRYETAALCLFSAFFQLSAAGDTMDSARRRPEIPHRRRRPQRRHQLRYGFTIQQVFLPKSTIEGLGMFAPRERSATVLAERHFGILGPSLNYYFGAGGHYGNNRDTGDFWGFDGLVGIEYKIAFIPFVVSFDFKPTIEYGSADWNRFPTAVSVRYIFLKKKKTGIFRALDGF